MEMDDDGSLGALGYDDLHDLIDQLKTEMAVLPFCLDANRYRQRLLRIGEFANRAALMLFAAALLPLIFSVVFSTDPM